MQTLDELNAQIAATLAPIARTETVALDDACGRVLAEAITSNIELPVADVSAMDGYAFTANSGDTLTLIGESIAGRPFAGTVGAGECVRIMTGAVVPTGANTVEMQENTTRDGGRITLTRPTPPRANIRYRGEELQLGETVLQPGKILSAADVLLLAALGNAHVRVAAPLTVVLLSSGDELVAPGEALTESGQIYDSNRALLKALLKSLPVRVHDLGIIRDDPAAIEAALQQAANSDAIITSGGVSVGDYDYLKTAVAKLGSVQAYKIKMKPGKPFVFGNIGTAAYFGLPGNPVSSFVGFSQIVRPALWQLAGANPLPAPLTLTVPLAAPVRKAVGRRDFQRGILENGSVHPQGGQDSHRVYGLARANCLIDLPADSGDQPAGATVTVWPFLASHRGGD